VVLGKLQLDKVEYLGHEVLLREIRKAVNEHHYKLDEAVDESVVKCAVVQSFLPSLRIESVLDAGLDHHIAEREKHVLILADLRSELCEIVVHFFLLRVDIFDVEQVDPLNEVAFQTLLQSSRTQGVND
jgi:hypothetical protein